MKPDTMNPELRAALLNRRDRLAQEIVAQYPEALKRLADLPANLTPKRLAAMYETETRRAKPCKAQLAALELRVLTRALANRLPNFDDQALARLSAAKKELYRRNAAHNMNGAARRLKQKEAKR